MLGNCVIVPHFARLYNGLHHSAALGDMEGRLDNILKAEEVFRRLGMTEEAGRNLRHRISAGRAAPERLPPLLRLGTNLVCFESVYNEWAARQAEAARMLMDRSITSRSAHPGRGPGRPRSNS